MDDAPRSHGLWARTAPPAPATAPLSGTAKADVAVIGAGYTGLSAALHLAESGARVIVLEAQEIGHGGSGRNVGLVNAGLWVMPRDVEKTLGPLHGPRLIDALGDGPALVWELAARHGMDCEAVHKGTLHCAADAKGLAALRERAAQWQVLGAPVELLAAEETARRSGTSAHAGALLDRRAGTIQPLAYARGLASAALEAGAIIHTQSPVQTAEPAADGWRLTTPQGSVEAPKVVVATNAYTTGPWPEIRQEIVHLPYFNFATAPLAPEHRARILPGGEGCWDTRKILTSFRLDAEGRLILGSVGALRGPARHVHHAWARRTLRGLYPALANIPFETEWYGMIGMTDDAMPRFHKLAPGVFAFCGYNGRGIAPGTVFGRLLARLLLGEVSEDDLPLPSSEPKPAPVRALRETAYEAGSALVHLTGVKV